MILFNTQFSQVYNTIIHNFLEIEIFNNDPDIDVGDIIEKLMPKYLFREQYKKCIKTFEDLFEWTQDEFYHEMKAFHELALYYFIESMAELKEDMANFNFIYFDKKSKSLIKKAAKIAFEEFGEISAKEWEEELFYDISSYSDYIFEELDFLLIDKLHNSRQLGNDSLEKVLGINIDFYFELLPSDIQEKYKTKHITLTGEIGELLDYIKKRIGYGSFYKLFWDNNKPVNEERIQLILENIMDAYFHSQKIEISREVSVGVGKVDFKLYKNDHEEEKILIEVKKANSSYLKKGYEKQLTEYMKATTYKNAFYLIACFTDEEYDKAEEFIKNHIYTDTIQLYINISKLDFRKRKTASKY